MRSWSEHGQAQDGITHHHCSILHEHGVKDAHPKLLPQNHGSMLEQLVEAPCDLKSLPLSASVEGNLFSVVQNCGVKRPVVALHVLFDGGQLSEGRGHVPDDDSGHEVPADGGGRTLPVHEDCKRLGEEDDVKERL